MTDLIKLVLDVIQYVWPFRRVSEWQKGLVYFCGRYWKEVGPGAYPIIWWFFEIRTVSMVLDVYTTPMQHITLRDGSTLDFSASVQLIVVDAAKAVNNVTRHEEQALEDAAAVLGERLGKIDPAKLDPEARTDLLRACRESLNNEIGEYGMKVRRLRFVTFARNVRTYRLFGDHKVVSPLDYESVKV